MKIDIHVHTNRHSECACSTPSAMVQGAIDAGLDAIVLTEHNYLWAEDELAKLQARFPSIKLFRGIEVSVSIDEHIVVLGVLDPGLFYPYMKPAEVMDVVRKHKGAVILAHPYRWSETVMPEVLEAGFDAVEINSTSIRNYMVEPILNLQGQWDVPLVASSDGHKSSVMGLYGIELFEAVDSEQDLARMIREGQFSLWSNDEAIDAINTEMMEQRRLALELVGKGVNVREALVKVGLSRNLKYALVKNVDMRFPKGIVLE